ncbi:hypothetical protein [Acidianus ambivalens]|uniref:Uncharacterized protein n=1 Tax=Acidianus ambivalens TaxID=2283 RepID=A0A650CTC5_ACIAM|nr:hypothetical protein [Acidianus ambivalens]MQL56455.1 hypothetical protein [Acidianus ambivalens]QGR21090.1 hypothetical protein D1866_02930 [Acidianus ambivalens]
MVAADVIYYYQGSITVYTTTMPIQLKCGPNGNVPSYITTTVGNAPHGYYFTATIYITNSTYDYFYHFLTIKACKPVTYLLLTLVQLLEHILNVHG